MNDKSVVLWAIENIQLPKKQKWSFVDRSWQIQILEDTSKFVVARKPTQIGMSVAFLTKMLYFADTNTARLMLTLPRDDDVSDMINSRMNEIIIESPNIQNKLRDVDNVRMKKFGSSFLHFVAMSTPPRMLDVDWLLNDEVDLSNPENLEQVVNRLDASSFGYHHQISTPSIDDYGIDKIYKLSDMKEWFVTCAYCNYEQPLDWDANVENNKSETWYKCAKCSNRLHAEDIREGRWLSTSENKSDISGYQINQMMCPWISPKKLWDEFTTKSKKNFYNLRLGKPYTPSNASISKEIIDQRCFESRHKKEFYKEQGATYVLGCDQGNVLHVSIGKIVNNNVQIVYLTTISFEDGFIELFKLMNRFGIRKGILDALPNHHDAQKISNDLRGNQLLVAYFSSVQKMYEQKENKVYINKTDAYDYVLQNIIDGKLQFPVSDNMLDVDMAVSHMCNMRRDIEIQHSKHGGISNFHVWKSVGPDHYADAILYMLMAADMISSSSGISVLDIEAIMRDPEIKKQNFYDLFGLAIDHAFDDFDIETYDNLPENILQERRNVLMPDNPYVQRGWSQ